MTNETVAVECCSCRVDKAIDYLQKKNTALWILSLGKSVFLEEEMPLFIIKRGKNWNKCFKIYSDFVKKQIKEIPSPLDTL